MRVVEGLSHAPVRVENLLLRDEWKGAVCPDAKLGFQLADFAPSYAVGFHRLCICQPGSRALLELADERDSYADPSSKVCDVFSD